MKHLLKFATGALALAIVSAPVAAQSVSVSLGIRETGADIAMVGIGGDGGSGGGIEWVNLDGLNLPLDGNWHLVSWDIANDPLTAFAGATADGILTTTSGTIEHLRIRNTDGLTGPITLWIDDVIYTEVTGAPSVIADFENFAVGDEVVFQEAGFSGSTSGNLAASGPTAVTAAMAFGGLQSDQADFQFLDSDPTRWLRLTTFNTPNTPNPAMPFTGTLSMRIKGVPEPATLGLMGLGGLAMLGRKRR